MNRQDRAKIIVLTPVRDEAAILPRFLQATLLWADAVIIADQRSTDRSVAIARSFPNVVVIENGDAEFSERSRQDQLIAAARLMFPGPRFLVALDADELLSANAPTAMSWRMATLAPPGTGVWLGRAELCPNLSDYFWEWQANRGQRGLFGFADDGSAHDGLLMHSPRLPTSPSGRQIALKDVFVLHLARGNMERVQSKECWYQCFERLQRPDLGDAEIRHRYNWFERRQGTFVLRPCPDEWFAGYRAAAIDLAEPAAGGPYWSDWEVLRLFARYGVAPFARLDIWSVDWERLRQQGLAAGIGGLPAQPIIPPTDHGAPL